MSNIFSAMVILRSSYFFKIDDFSCSSLASKQIVQEAIADDNSLTFSFSLFQDIRVTFPVRILLPIFISLSKYIHGHVKILNNLVSMKCKLVNDRNIRCSAWSKYWLRSYFVFLSKELFSWSQYMLKWWCTWYFRIALIGK